MVESKETLERNDTNARTETEGKTQTVGSKKDIESDDTKTKTRSETVHNDVKSETDIKGNTKTETVGRTDTVVSKKDIESDSKTKTKTRGSTKTETVGRTDTVVSKKDIESDSKTKTNTRGSTKIETVGKTDTVVSKKDIESDSKSKTELKSETRSETVDNDSRTKTKSKIDTLPTRTVTRTDTTADETSGTGPVCSASLFQDSNVPDVTQLLDRLNSEELTDLRIHFYEKKVDEKIKEPKGSAHPRFRGFKLKQDEFVTAIENVLETTEYELAANRLFERLTRENAEEHKGFLWWEQILDELIDFMSEKTKSRPSNLVKESFCSLYPMSHCRRETIVRVVPVETQASFCFVVVSKYGKLGIYDWNMSLLDQLEVRLSTQIATTGGEVKRTTWVTDAVYMYDAATLLVAASDRSLHFYATSGLVCVPVYHISGLPNTPTCLHYTESTSEGPSMLLVGDDHGSIATMYFQQPQYALFKRTSNDALDKYFWKELNSQKAWVIISMDHGIHKDEITRVEYFSDNNTVVSCSNDPKTTVIIRYIVGRRAPYVFKVSRGVRCFHLDRSLRLLATGGKDSVVRLWNPIIPKKPVASLFGHKCSIVDVRILKHLNAILSMSKDTVVKVWDIQGQTCMQSLPLLFPVHGMLARFPEFGVRSFYPGPVSCKQASLTPIGSTEIVLSPRTLTDASSSRYGSTSGLTSPSKTTHATTEPSSALSRTETQYTKTTINPVVSVYTLSDPSKKTDDQSVKTDLSNFGNLEAVPSVAQNTEARTMTQYTQISDGSEGTGSCLGSPWIRMELLAVCCNYIVILQLSERELQEGEDKRVGASLEPPLRNQDPAAPSPWLTVDPALLTGLTDIDAPPRDVDESATVPPAVLATLQKSLGEEMTRDFTSLAASCYERGTQQTDLKQIRVYVEQCAPHLALGAVDVEEIPYSYPPTVHLRKSRKKAEDAARGRDTMQTTTVPRTSMVTTDESNVSFSAHTTTTTNSTITPKSND